MNKKGDTVVFETVIFVILNIVFAGILLLFIVNSSYGAMIYEQTYAKQIALLIDNAKPGMNITIEMYPAIQAAQKFQFKDKKLTSTEVLTEMVKIDSKTNQVIVSLSGRGGYSYKYFSDYNVQLVSRGIILQIQVEEKNE